VSINWKPFAIIAFLIALSCCSSDSTAPRGGTTAYDTPKTFFSTMTNLTVEIAYEPEAEPYVGNDSTAHPLWDFVKENLDALFVGRTVTVTVPTTLAEMQAIPDQNKTTFSLEAIYTLAEKYRKGRSTATQGNFFLLFLDGYYEENGEKNESVIGINISGTTILVMFKPVIKNSAVGGAAIVPKFVEITTAVHEIAHGLGLVNNGIPMKTSHQDGDAEHGKHCDDDQCVMYYLNEGASDLKDFVIQLIASGDRVVFDQKCLDDARNYHP